jgi:hypothetical protein
MLLGPSRAADPPASIPNASLFLFMPWIPGAYAREEIAPVLWKAFVEARSKHGITDEMFMSIIVLFIDIVCVRTYGSTAGLSLTIYTG